MADSATKIDAAKNWEVDDWDEIANALSGLMPPHANPDAAIRWLRGAIVVAVEMIELELGWPDADWDGGKSGEMTRDLWRALSGGEQVDGWGL